MCAAPSFALRGFLSCSRGRGVVDLELAKMAAWRTQAPRSEAQHPCHPQVRGATAARPTIPGDATPKVAFQSFHPQASPRSSLVTQQSQGDITRSRSTPPAGHSPHTSTTTKQPIPTSPAAPAAPHPHHVPTRKDLRLQPRRQAPPPPSPSHPKSNPCPPVDLKNTTDDAIPNYLNSLSFRQSHTLSDVRLTLGYLALATAAACFAWDYKLGFEATKLPTAAAVALYAVLNTALTAWIFLVERGAVYVGTSPDGRARVRITSASVKGKVPEYRLTVEVSDAATGRVQETVEVRRGFNHWFDAAGRFVAAPFQVLLAGQVGVIGQADPKRREAAKAEGKGTVRVVEESVSAGYTAEMLAALQGAEATGAEAEAGKKGGKRRKA